MERIDEAPLAEPGIQVREGDYLLAVNGVPLKAPQNVYAAFEGTAGKQTRIKVGASPGDAAARDFIDKPVPNENALRYVAWVTRTARSGQSHRRRIAYIHVPDTAVSGMREFTRQYYPQIDKSGIIVDERWNGGGFIPDFSSSGCDAPRGCAGRRATATGSRRRAARSTVRNASSSTSMRARAAMRSPTTSG
jgi:tricorn protease